MTDKGNALAGVRCPILPGSGNYHFRLAGCDDCNIRDFARLTLEAVERLCHAGYVGQAMFEAYRHVWATAAPRFSSLGNGWADPPTDPEVVALAALFRAELARRSPITDKEAR